MDILGLPSPWRREVLCRTGQSFVLTPLVGPLFRYFVRLRDASDLRHVKVTHHWAKVSCFYLIFESQMLPRARCCGERTLIYPLPAATVLLIVVVWR